MLPNIPLMPITIIWVYISNNHKLLLLPMMMIWIFMVNYHRLLLSFYGSVIFACLEMIHYKLNYGIFFTTKEQFIANFIFMPFMIEDYNILFPNRYFKYLIFPFDVWLFEIIMGYSMIFILGKNPAWTYNTKYSYFRGQIALECYPRWFFLGIFQDLLYSYCFDQMIQIQWQIFVGIRSFFII
jgi:hypothetical protein